MQPLLKQMSSKNYIFRKHMFVALGIQRAMHTVLNVICYLSNSNKFFYIITSMT